MDLYQRILVSTQVRSTMCDFYKFVVNYFTYFPQYGYILSNSNTDNKVVFKSKDNQIELFYSVAEYELSCQFTDNFNYTFSLQDALDYLDIRDYRGIYQINSKEELESGVLFLSNIIKDLLDKVDISNSLNFQRIAQYTINVRKEMLEEYYFKKDIDEAEEHWKNKEYNTAKELYEKHNNRLAISQIRKLEYINKNLM